MDAEIKNFKSLAV